MSRQNRSPHPPSLRIIQAGHPILREKLEEVENIDIHVERAARRMGYALRVAKGLAVAANQVGYTYRMFVYLNESGAPVPVINPVIVEASDNLIEGPEECLSIRGKTFTIPRPEKLTISYIDLAGNEQTVEGEGIMARCFAHEIDHLNGLLISEYLGDVNDDVPTGERPS